MNGTTELTCPKCGAEMRSYERNGVTLDQCTGCRGVFLDRGELERLIDAEGSFYEQREERHEPERERRHEEKHGGQKPKKSKKRSFLENILEGMGE